MSAIARKLTAIFVTWICATIFLLAVAYADVVPGDVIDKTNYQKIEGLVPDFILNWVRDSDLTMKIGKLNYDPSQFWPREVKDNSEANVGRYRIDEHNGIIDVKTGQPARGIKGLPFPKPDPSDPTFPQMLMWNFTFVQNFLQGDMKEIQYWFSVTRHGLEKSIELENLSIPLDPTKDGFDFAQLTVFRQPFDLAGIGTLVTYALYPLKEGIRYAYTPELRRLKRLSSRVAGSDVHFGLDNSPDDSWAGGPMTNFNEGTYRFIGEKEAIVPVQSEDPAKIDYNKKGELDVGYEGTGLKMQLGFEEPNWKGAPWHPVNVVWVKTPVWVIESRSKDPNYGYGPCEGWIQKGSFFHCYKRVTDPNGKLWKGVYWPAIAIETPDGNFRIEWTFGWIQIDMRRDHGSSLVGPYWKGAYRKILVKDMNKTLFSQAGFIKYAK